jgi:hypothetical protein
MRNWFAKLQRLDRRWLYLATFLMVFLPILVPIPVGRLSVAKPTRALFDYIEALPAGTTVLVDSSWDSGSLAENEAQLKCVIRHLCRKRIRIVVTSVGVTALGPTFAKDTIQPIADEFGYKYGVDWVNCGYVQGVEGSIGAIIDGLSKDFLATFPTDVTGQRLADMPIMSGFRGIQDAQLVYVLTYAPAPEWISFVKEQFDKPVAFGAMSIMAPQYINNFEARQLAGLLIGNRGAAEYEQLLGHPGQGQRLAVAGSFGAIAVIAAAILGNVAWWAERRSRRGR